MVTEPGNYTEKQEGPGPSGGFAPTSPCMGRSWESLTPCLARSPAAGAQALDLASLGRRNVVRTASHLTHEALLLHLAAELAQSLFELLGILDDYSHNPSRIQAGRLRGAHPESSTARAGYVTDSAG